MSLKQNGRLDNQYPISGLGSALLNDRAGWCRNDIQSNRVFGQAGWSKTAAIANGYTFPYCWYPAISSGGIACVYGIRGTGATNTPIIAGGKLAESTIISVGLITTATDTAKGIITTTITANGIVYSASLASAIQAVATLYGSGSITNAAIRVLADIVATIVSLGDIQSANLNSLVPILATITSSGVTYSVNLAGGKYITGTIEGIADLDVLLEGSGVIECTISIGDRPSAYDIAQAIWEEPTAAHTTDGTMGKAMSNAGSSGDPWGTLLPGAYGEGTAGKIVSQILSFAGQNNFRIKDQDYTAGKLTSATIRIYANETDAENDEDPVAELHLSATYDGDGNCTSYVVTKV